MKRWVAAAFVALLPIPGFAKEQLLRKFRIAHSPNQGASPMVAEGASAAPSPDKVLQGAGEFILRGGQRIGRAHVAGTWKQTILNEQGEIAYAAGAVLDKKPQIASLKEHEAKLSEGLRLGLANLSELKTAARVFPPQLEVKETSGKWVAYWRVEYLTPKQDQLRYVHISETGEVIQSGALDWDGVDGRALVFPRGPKESGVREETLRDLSGDGTISGRLLHVMSALDLKVWSPELTFFFPQNDRRFDLGQAYFTIDQGFRWLKDRLGVELDHPIEVRLHVGDNGASNAAFYHKNTIYLGAGDNVTYRDMIRDPSILIHESIHSVIDAYVGLPSDGEGGGFNEGFADLFAALILDNPRMGEASYLKGPYRRTLENQLKAYKDFAPGVYQNGTIVGATFWDMKARLGTELTAKLAFRTLVRLGRGAQFDDFGGALTSAAEGVLSPEQKAFALEVASNRGWKMP